MLQVTRNICTTFAGLHTAWRVRLKTWHSYLKVLHTSFSRAKERSIKILHWAEMKVKLTAWLFKLGGCFLSSIGLRCNKGRRLFVNRLAGNRGYFASGRSC